MQIIKCSSRTLKLLSCFTLSFLLTFSQATLWLPDTIANSPTSPVSLTERSRSHSVSRGNSQQGRTLYKLGQYAEAAYAWEQAARQYEQRGDTLSQSSTLSNLALAYQALGEITESEEAIAQSLTLLTQLTATSDTASTFAQVWNTQGNLLLMRSQPTQSLEAFQTATTYYRQANDTTGTLRAEINQARTLQSFGFYRRALLLLTDLNPPLTEQPDTTTKLAGLQLFGDLQRTVGDLATAQTTLKNGLAIAQTLNAPATTASILLSLGHTASANGETEQALDYYQQVSQATEDQHLKLRAQLSQHNLLSKLNNNTEASQLTANIQSTLNSLPTSRISVNARLTLARQQLDHMTESQASASGIASEITSEIAQNLAIAKQQSTELKDISAESYALGYLGELYAKQQQITEAKTALQQALELANDLSSSELAYQWNWQLGLLERQQGETTAAIAHYKSAVDELQLLTGNLVSIAPDLRFDFTEKVEPVYRGLVDLLLLDTKSSNNPDNIQQDLIIARQTIESLQLAELENYFQEPCVPVTQQVDQIIDSSASPAAVIYPIILSDRVEIILKLPNQPLQQFTTTVPETELETLLFSLQRNLRLPYTINTVQSQSAQLYDWLIRPAASTLESNQIDTLIFVLDGFLRSIPMSTLYDGQQYLIENYSIALTPGLQLTDPQALNNQQLATVVAGLSESPHDGFSALPFVENEVEQVKQTTPSRVLLNEAFTESNLKAAINNTDYPLVHLATHGQFSDDPNETFILAWDKRIQVNELSQLLRQGELNRQASIELLILSACETAVGDKRAALGLAGIALQAGARSTLASLWNLDDESSALFSSYFYQELLKPNASKAEALRNAQLKLLGKANTENTSYQHPLYWAPYILLGSWL
ncbi:MAG: CHAT domain-containing protein [Cyanobacteria bacterium J06650_10]